MIITLSSPFVIDHSASMSSDLASLIVLFILALALVAATLAGLWLYTYGTTFDPALGTAIDHIRELQGNQKWK
jgi:hypothetical protein